MGWNSNVFPLLLVTSSTGFTGLFAYSPGPGPGNLVASVTSHAGTDPFGNAYVAGVASYAAGTPAINADMTGGALQFNRPAINAAAVVGSNNSAILLLASGRVAVADVEAILTLGPGLAGVPGVAALTGASFELQEIAVPVADGGITAGPKLFGNTTGQAEYVADSLNGDGNSYDMGRLFLHGTALPQTFSSTSPVDVTGTRHAVGANIRYRFKAYISFHGGIAAGTARFNLSGPNTASVFDMAAMFITNTGVANNGTTASWVTGASGFVQSPTLTTGANIAYIEGEVIFTTSGTFALQCFEGTVGDTVIVDNVKWDIMPVVAT